MRSRQAGRCGWRSVLGVTAFLLLPAAALAANRDECLTCHTMADLRRDDGGSLSVDATGFDASAHGRLDCVACHTGAARIPHATPLPRPRCASCHADAVAALRSGVHARLGDRDEACRACHGGAHTVRPVAAGTGEACATCHREVAAEYAGSIHGMRRAQGDGEVSSCRDCHGATHAVRSHRDPRASTSRDSLASTCARCHADRELVTRRRITIPAAVALYRSSVHGRSQDPRAPTCNDCHESHRLRRANDPASSIYRSNVPRTCGRCHAREAADYGAGVHGTAVERGVTRSPVCTDCHGEHRIRGPHEPGSPVAAAGVTATCSHCHEAIGIRETFGLPAGRLSSYADSYHGLAARGGAPAVANCASCHGYHRILPSSDTASAIHPTRLPATCGKCHPGAGERFARGAVHVVMARPDRPLLGMVRAVYLWLIALTIGGMLAHNLLDFGHKLRARLRAQVGGARVPVSLGAASAHAVTAGAHAAVAHAAGALVDAGGRWFLRMTVVERLQHALLAVSFFTLVFTGFALKFPESWLFAWLARLEDGERWRGLIHRGAAVVMVAGSLWHVAYLLTRRGRQLVRDLLPARVDLVQPFQNIGWWLGLRREPPAFDRFGYIEKLEYWALVWGTVVMTVTGLVLWFENQSLQWFDKWVLDLATLVHYYEAWLAFLAIVVWHLYQNIANPDVYPMNWTWLHGRIGEAQLRHEHAAEWARLAGVDRDAPEADAPEADAPEAAAPVARASGPLEPADPQDEQHDGEDDHHE